MKILITTQYFYPENFIINDLAKMLRDLGHDITVATGKPNYPSGKIYKGFKATGINKDYFDKDIKIIRVPIWPRKKNKLSIIINYISFIVSGSILFPILLYKDKFDFILHYGPGPILSAIPSLVLKYSNKSHLVTWVQDLWPEGIAVHKTVIINNYLFISIFKILNKIIFKFSDTILVQSKALVAPIEKYVKNNKVKYYPNSIIENKSDNISHEGIPFRILDIFKKNKCIVFAGNLGRAQSIETIVKVARILKNISEVKIVIIGSGPLLGWAKIQKNEKKLDNLILTGSFDVKFMRSFYELAFALLITLKSSETLDYTIPSKLQSYLASGKPIIGALNGESARIINDSKSGMVCNAEDAIKLADNIIKLSNLDKESIAIYSKNARDYFNTEFNMKNKASELIEMIKNEHHQKSRVL
jgi:glycosyltransferase involved in cell wall biosynthesis